VIGYFDAFRDWGAWHRACSTSGGTPGEAQLLTKRRCGRSNAMRRVLPILTLTALGLAQKV